jgi:hypothetical protein
MLTCVMRLGHAFILSLLIAPGCKSRGHSEQGAPGAARAADASRVVCIRQQDGCILCVAPHGGGEVDEHGSRRCNPAKPAECVDFCTQLASDCATPWYSGPNCLAQSEEEFRRRQFWLDVAERPEAELLGRVLDAESKRADGAHVELGDGTTVVAETTCGKEGGFRLPLRAGVYTVRITKAGQATLLDTVKLVPERPPQLHVFRLNPDQRISGRVVDEAGAAVAAAQLAAVRSNGDALSTAETQAGPDGTFTLRGLDVHRYALRVVAFGYRAAETPRVQAPQKGVVVHMNRTHVVRGVIKDAAGAPVPQARILVTPTGGTAASAVSVWASGEGGRFALDGFASGTYLMWAQKDDRLTYPPMKLTLEAEDPEPLDLVLSLAHEGALVTGRLVDESDHALAGARVDLVPRWPLALPVPLGADTGPDGKFAVDGLSPGRYEISVRLGTRPLAVIAGARDVQVPIEAGEEVDVEGRVKVRTRID